MEQHHNYTGLLLLLFVILAALSAIFLTVAQSKLVGFAEYKNGNSKLRTANNYLIAAYILGYIATGMGLILAIVYFAHASLNFPSEIPHLLIFILIFGLIIVSAIFGFVALSNIDSANPPNRSQSTNWIWAGVIAALVAVVVLIISGAWRAQHRSTHKVVNVGDVVAGVAPVTTTISHKYVPVPGSDLSNDALPPSYPAPALSSVAAPSVVHSIAAPSVVHSVVSQPVVSSVVPSLPVAPQVIAQAPGYSTSYVASSTYMPATEQQYASVPSYTAAPPSLSQQYYNV